MVTTRRKKKADREQQQQVISVTGITDNQKKYIKSIDKNDVIFCTGPAGCGKSYIAAGMAAQMIHRGDVENIVVTRPLEPAGRDLGALPGELHQRIAPYLKPMEKHLKYFLKVYYGQYANDKHISYEPLELMRGSTFDNSFMILDEAQNCTMDQIKMFITRMGKGSKVLINGDTHQTDLYGSSGLKTCFDKLSSVPDVACVKLTIDDIQRHGIIGKVLSALERESYNNSKPVHYDEGLEPDQFESAWV